MKIYKTTNLINSKIYIGQTIRNNPNYIGGGIYLKSAIKKYGKENFKCEIIVDNINNRFLLDELEKHYIRLYNSTNKNIGYNLEEGGNTNKIVSKETIQKQIINSKRIGNKYRLGKPFSLEARKKLSIARKKRIILDSTKRKISESLKGNKWNVGKKVSNETKKRLSEVLKKAYKEGRRISNKGIKRSDEFKIKISIVTKGKNNPNFGKKCSEETRKKMSEAKKGRVPWNKNLKIKK